MCASVCECRGQGTVYGSWSFPSPTGIQRNLQLCGKCHYFSAPLPASDWKRDFIALGRLRLTVETRLLLNLWMFLLLLPPEHWGLGALFFFFFFLPWEGFTWSAHSKGKCWKKRGRGGNDANTVCSCVKFSKKLKLKTNKQTKKTRHLFYSLPFSAPWVLGVWDHATMPSPPSRYYHTWHQAPNKGPLWENKP